MPTLYAKIGLVLLATIGCLLLAWWRKPFQRRLPSSPDWLLVIAFVLCRIVPFAGLYIVVGLEPRSDVPIFYDMATSSLWGEVVYRDFWSPYSPLFTYLMGLPLLLWHNIRMITLLMILTEGVAWWLTYRYYQRTDSTEAKQRRFWVALLYLLLPAPLVFSVLGGQEDLWIWLFGILSVYGWRWRDDALWLGMGWAVALIATKALTVFLVLGLLTWIARPWRFIAGLAVVGLPALVLTVGLTGKGILTPLSLGTMRFAPNGWTVLAPIIGDFMTYVTLVNGIGLVALLLVSLLSGWQLRRSELTYPQALPLLWVLVYGTLMLVHKSSFGNYTYLFLLPLVLTQFNWHSRLDWVMLLLLAATSAIHPTLWWQINQPIHTSWQSLQGFWQLTEYLLGISLLVSVFYFVRQAYQQTVKHKVRRSNRILTY